MTPRSRAWAVHVGFIAGGLAALCTSALAAPFFVEASPGETGLTFVHFNGMSGELYYAEHMGPGGALVDYDGDGDLDAYLGQGRMLGDKPLAAATFPAAGAQPLSDRLFRNDSYRDRDGRLRVRFTDVTQQSGLAADGYAMGVATGDFDDDGRIDLYVTNLGSNQLWRNRGDGTFEDVTAASGTDDPRWSTSASFLDFDGDGRLDLFVVNYVNFRPALHKVCLAASGSPDYCGPQSYPPVADRLFRNRGDGTFEDVTGPAGLLGARGTGLGVVAGDFDGDRRLDLYVANDLMRNHLWIQAGAGTFIDDALLAGVAADRSGQVQASMGVVAEDLDGDGYEDLFMTHLTGDTNTVYVNDGTALFQDRSAESRLAAPSLPFTGFGVAAIDVDADGWVDLAIANGAVRLQDEQLAAGEPHPLGQRNQLFRNLGGTFEEVADAGPAFTAPEVSRGLAAGDVDLDGAPDLLLLNNAGPVRLLLSRASGRGNWIGLRVLTRSGRDDLGATVVVEAAGRTQRRRVRTDGSYCSASDPRLLFGLGATERVDTVTVRRTDGTHLSLLAPPAGRYLTLPGPP